MNGNKMIHEMSLEEEPFEKIKKGEQTIEVRVYDEKRKRVKVGDTIVFSKRPDRKLKFSALVTGLSIFASFRGLFEAFEPSKFGFSGSMTPEEKIVRMRRFYSQQEEKANGVVGIHIKALKQGRALA